MKSLKNTRTAENLMKAFAGEAQARNRYTYFASKANKENYPQIEEIFLETADNEAAHAKRFYKFLEKDFQGAQLKVEADYPVEIPETTEINLRFAADGEHNENSNLYPVFADIAVEEGFPEIATCIRMIAKAEVAHENRFRKLADNIKNGTVFKKDDKETLWKCGICGFIYEGPEAPKACPSCKHPQKFFEVFKETY